MLSSQQHLYRILWGHSMKSTAWRPLEFSDWHSCLTWITPPDILETSYISWAVDWLFMYKDAEGSSFDMLVTCTFSLRSCIIIHNAKPPLKAALCRTDLYLDSFVCFNFCILVCLTCHIICFWSLGQMLFHFVPCLLILKWQQSLIWPGEHHVQGIFNKV